MKYSQIRTQVSPVRVPDALMGKRAGIFFLLNEMELRKQQAKKRVTRPGNAVPRAPGMMGAGSVQSKAFLLTDEFIFS